MKEKWNARNNKKGYLKIHVAVDVKTKKILSMKKVTDEHVHDSSKELPELVDNIIKSDDIMTTKTTIGKLFGDGVYEGNEIFRYLGDNGILPCIKVRKTPKVKLKTSHILRNLSVISQKNGLQDGRIERKLWKEMDCRNRVFLYKKNVWRIYVYSVKFENMIKEMVLLASLYNKMISI